MTTSGSWLATKHALRLLWGVAALGILLERAPWSQHGALVAADGYLAFVALGLSAVTGGESGWSRKLLLLFFAAWIAVMLARLSGT